MTTKDRDVIDKWLEKFTVLKEAVSGDHNVKPESIEKILGNSPTAEEVAEMFTKLREAYETADFVKKRLGEAFDWYRVTYVPDYMDDQGVSSVKIEDVGRLGLTDDLRVKILDKESVYDWLEENDLGDLITSTINSSTLKATLRRRLIKGQEVPGDLFELSPFTRANLTKS